MELNKIRFVPKSNAFADVYGKATGMPFVGEIVAAAAGIVDEPEPEPEPVVTKCATPTYTTSQPSINCGGSTLYDKITVTLACATENSTIHYKVSGLGEGHQMTAEDYDFSSYPLINSDTYTSPYTQSYRLVMMAYATADGLDDSDILYITLDVEGNEESDEFIDVMGLDKCGAGELLAINGECPTATLSSFSFSEDMGYSYCGTDVNFQQANVTVALSGSYYSDQSPENINEIGFNGNVRIVGEDENETSVDFNLIQMANLDEALNAEKSALLTAYKNDGNEYYVYEFNSTEFSEDNVMANGNMFLPNMYQSYTVTPYFGDTQFTSITLQNECYEEPQE